MCIREEEEEGEEERGHLQGTPLPLTPLMSYIPIRPKTECSNPTTVQIRSVSRLDREK